MFIDKLIQGDLETIMGAVVIIFSVCCHEYAHAQMALWQGDSTAADEGHLTLNPLRQMGFLSIVMLLLAGITWGQVPVNPRLMRRRYSEALVAFSGPLMNIILFLAFCVLAFLTSLKFGSSVDFFDLLHASPAFLLFVTGAVMNVVLFVFNMLPVPPLDGWTVFAYMFPKVHNINPELRNGVIVGLFFLAVFSFRYLYIAGTILTVLVLRALDLPLMFLGIH